MADVVVTFTIPPVFYGGLALVIILQIGIFLLLLKRQFQTEPKPTTREEKEASHSTTKESEAEEIKGILADPKLLTVYANAKYHGKEERAREALEKRYEKLTGEPILAPWK